MPMFAPNNKLTLGVNIAGHSSANRIWSHSSQNNRIIRRNVLAMEENKVTKYLSFSSG